MGSINILSLPLSLNAVEQSRQHQQFTDNSRENKVVVVAQAVAHRTTDQKVPFSNPAGRWAFFLSLSSRSLLFPIFQSVVRPESGPSWRCNTTGFQLSKKKKFLAMPSSGKLV